MNTEEPERLLAGLESELVNVLRDLETDGFPKIMRILARLRDQVRPDGALGPDGPLGEETHDQFRRTHNQVVRGLRDAHGEAVRRLEAFLARVGEVRQMRSGIEEVIDDPSLFDAEGPVPGDPAIGDDRPADGGDGAPTGPGGPADNTPS